MTDREERPRVTILTEARIGNKMGGTGIRYLEVAKQLSRHLKVHLGSVYGVDSTFPGIETFVWKPGENGVLRERLSSVDVILIHGFVLEKLPWIRDLDARIVVDLYCPFIFENSQVFRDRRESTEERQTYHDRDRDVLLRQLEVGDFFLCSCSRQRDWIFGLLSATGQLGPEVQELRGTPDSLVGIVPIGLVRQPRPVGGAFKGRWPGIGETDIVLIWGGGLWSWLDAETIIRAMAGVCRERDDVKLFFLSRRTAEDVIEMPATRRAIELAAGLGLERTVFFNDAYVSYSDRGAYFGDADVGVSAHLQTLESHFSFRTRMLDYLNAGLPILTSEGDFFGELVERHGAGRALPVGDVKAWTQAILDLAEAPELRKRMAARSLALRESFTWETCVEPLVEFCLQPPRRVSPRGKLRGWGGAEDIRAIEKEYREVAAYARKVEEELGKVKAVERDCEKYARRLEKELDRLRTESGVVR